MTKFALDNQNHRTTVSKVRSLIENDARKPLATRKRDLEIIDAAHEAHIHAKTDFDLHNSDATMINLIGTWARISRIKMEMEEKYEG